MTLLLLIRHGENDFVKTGKMAGRLPGVHLNDRGEKQAQALGEALKDVPLKAIYSSPLERAMETANPIAKSHKLKIIQEPDLMDTDIGKWQGKSLKMLRLTKAWKIVQSAPSRFRFPEGESFIDAQTRYVDTLERMEILRELRLGIIDVLVGVNLLREGLDLPEVSLVAILDADKEGFLRNEKSLTQTAGRAARNINGLVIFYADKMTQSMQKTIDETNRRREKQVAFNITNDITPTTIIKSKEQVLAQGSILDVKGYDPSNPYSIAPDGELVTVAAEEQELYKTIPQMEKGITKIKKEMDKAGKNLDFMEAARLRDEMFRLKIALEEMKKNN